MQDYSDFFDSNFPSDQKLNQYTAREIFLTAYSDKSKDYWKKQAGAYEKAIDRYRYIMTAVNDVEKLTAFRVKLIDDLSEDILEEIQGNFYETPFRQEQFRQSIIRFLEIALNKIIWYPSDGQDTWKSVKLFAHQIYKLHQTDIIDEDELDDFYKSLLERFCYYLDMHGSGISLKTLAIIRSDITSKKLHFLELEEQEAYLEPKPERLKRALIIAEAKIHAHAQGIVT